MNKLQLRAARRQMLGLGILLAAGIGGMVWNRQRPADAEQVKIPVAELGSDAAELLLLNQLEMRIPAPFARAHGKQLAAKIESSQSDIESLHLADLELDRIRRATTHIARELANIADTRGHAPVRSVQAKIDQLRTFEKQLGK
jgi:hypothetical protein